MNRREFSKNSILLGVGGLAAADCDVGAGWLY
jgi:hypothetical protein